MAIFRYKLFVPLHELWLQYINQLYGTSGLNAFSQKLLKADFHGVTLTGFKYIDSANHVCSFCGNCKKTIKDGDKLSNHFS